MRSQMRLAAVLLSLNFPDPPDAGQATLDSLRRPRLGQFGERWLAAEGVERVVVVAASSGGGTRRDVVVGGKHKSRHDRSADEKGHMTERRRLGQSRYALTNGQCSDIYLGTQALITEALTRVTQAATRA